MLRKQLIEQRGFRDLLPEEVEHVSGGLYGNEYLPDDFGIVVTGSSGGGFNFGGLGFGLGGIGSIGAASGAGTGGGGSSVADAVDNSDDFNDEDGDGLDDNTGQPLTIVVPGDPSTLDGFELGPINPATGITHYMYPVGPDGTVVPGTPPVATPEGEQFACDTFAEAQEAIADTEAQFGFLNNVIGFSPLSWLTWGVLTPQSQQEAPAHCP